MQPIIVVNNPRTLPISIPGIDVIPAKAYLIDPTIEYERDTMIFNLCRSYRYQSIGYYVSLLAAARGHRPLPSVSAIQDMKSMTMVRYASEDLEELIQTSLHRLQSREFTLSIYFGRNMARAYDRLSRELFNLFRAPLLRAHFHRDEDKWSLVKIGPIGANEITMEHWPFVVETATDYFSRPRYSPRKKTNPRYDIAILHCPEEANPPSNERALKRFEKAAAAVGMEAELIDKDDYGRLAEFDALFIRETTQVNHHTFRFARRAEAEGLVVIDDPKSILRCCNKVYLAELLDRHKIPAPKTVVVHKDNVEEVSGQVGLPCILKQPDSSFSQGVVKVDTEDELQREAERLLDRSDLIIGQEFIPTEFDWRVGIIDQKPLYVCRYHMAPKHWQIQQNECADGKIKYGRVEAIPLKDAPRQVVSTALRAANLIGNGLYGVDLKQVGRHVYVIEINDNPSLDCGYEDGILKEDLYMKVMQVFLKRIERIKNEGANR
ncbi:MAG: RimK family protein [Candidatus Sumerlaeia bacterium]